MYGKLKAVEVLPEFKIGAIAPLYGEHARLGVRQMMSALTGAQAMEGYRVSTDEHEFLVLIDSSQSCCESFGYLSTDDDFTPLLGAELLSVDLTDVSRFKKTIEELEYLDEGGVQFVDFVTDKGVFQLAVYNGHNGWYGHGILVAKDDEILLNSTI